ncbi:MAG: hypothetical protein M1838_005052 [Thelocarpon superellum]|nr:MAG: hypothetical protein M1838_005052 [Thelocarpon superellum]
MASTVTIDKAYFETLLRRAEFHVSDHDFSTPVHLPTVTIPKPDHDILLRRVHEYDKLRAALFRGGIQAQTLEILISGDAEVHDGDRGLSGVEKADASSMPFLNGGPPLAALPRPASSLTDSTERTFGPHASATGNFLGTRTWDSHFRMEVTQTDSASCESVNSLDKVTRSTTANGTPNAKNPVLPGHSERRTVVLTNLADRTTHKDIASVVRGGLLLDIFLRTHDRSANVSFVHGEAAQAFINHAKRNDTYLHGRRVEIRWGERHFKLLGHVANKIVRNGATRNLVIRNVRLGLTAETLREHLDHIHNLVVVNIAFQEQHAYISLNSIHNALFARTCMMSRGAYKGMRIDWYPDECAQPLPKSPVASRKEYISQRPVKIMSAMNRFDLLNLDGSDDTSEKEDLENHPNLLIPVPAYTLADASVAG